MDKRGRDLECGQDAFNLAKVAAKRESAYRAFPRSHADILKERLLRGKNTDDVGERHRGHVAALLAVDDNFDGRHVLNRKDVALRAEKRQSAAQARVNAKDQNTSPQSPLVAALLYSVARFSKKLVCSGALSISSIQGIGLVLTP